MAIITIFFLVVFGYRMAHNVNNKRSMRTEIIEILQKKYPEYCMQHIDTADEILRLFNVSNSLDLLELERKIDEALDNETSESLKEWLHSKRL